MLLQKHMIKKSSTIPLFCNKPPYISLVCSSPQHFNISFFHCNSIDGPLRLQGNWQGAPLLWKAVGSTKGTYFLQKWN